MHKNSLQITEDINLYDCTKKRDLTSIRRENVQ